MPTNKRPEPTRQTQRADFMTARGLGTAKLDALAQDASFRRYFRVVATEDHDAQRQQTFPLMLMDAPPPTEDVRPFVAIAKHLNQRGLRTPRIVEVDAANGFVLLEDLGNSTFTQLLNTGHDPYELYNQAIDVLIRLHRDTHAADIDVADYSEDKLIAEANLFVEWYVPTLIDNEVSEIAATAWSQAWRETLKSLPPCGQTLVLRDYHVDNLMRVSDEKGRPECALLDFQDAVIGSPAYDLVSLLEDARRDADPQLVAHLWRRYTNAFNDRRHENWLRSLSAWYDVLGAQRHAKVLGIFTRLSVRDAKHQYRIHLPRVRRLFKSKLGKPELSAVRAWCEEYVVSLLSAD